MAVVMSTSGASELDGATESPRASATSVASFRLSDQDLAPAGAARGAGGPREQLPAPADSGRGAGRGRGGSAGRGGGRRAQRGRRRRNRATDKTPTLRPSAPDGRNGVDSS